MKAWVHSWPEGLMLFFVQSLERLSKKGGNNFKSDSNRHKGRGKALAEAMKSMEKVRRMTIRFLE